MPADLRKSLSAFGRWMRLRDAAVALALLFFATAVLFAAGCAVDRVVDIPGAWRLPFTCLTGLVALALTLRFLLVLCRPQNYDQLAHALDVAAGDSRGHLRSLLDFSRRQLPLDSFAGISIARASQLWRTRSVRSCVSRRPLRLIWGALAVAVILASVSQIEAVRADLLLRRFLDPLGNYARPTSTWFEVEAPSSKLVHGGDDYLIRARLRGRVLLNPRPLARLSPAEAPPSVTRMQAASDGFWELPLKELRGDLDFELTLGSARSARYHVRVEPRPVIEGIHLAYQFPNYTRLPDRQEALSGRTITALEGTKIKIEVRCNIPLQSLAGLSEKEQRTFTLDPHDSRKAWRYHFVSSNERMELLLKARNGLDNAKELPLNFRLIPDTPPVVTITNDPGSRAFFPNEVVSIAYKAQDDLGLSEVALVAAHGDFSQEAELEKFGARESAGTIRVPVSAAVQPGASSAQLRVTALDTKGQRAASPPVTLKIASNSYDRQLRAALRAFTSSERSGNPQSGERLGFPALLRQTQKLKDLRSTNAKITVLRELLSDGATPGSGESKQINEVRMLLTGANNGTLGPVFPYLVPFVTPGHGGIRAIDVLGRAPMLPRLQRIVRDAACGAELAISREELSALFEKAMTSANPKAELGSIQTLLAAAIARQEPVTSALGNEYRILQLELAGYLASTLDLTLRRAGKTGIPDNDERGAAMSKLRELGALLAGPLAEIPEPAQKAAIEQALKAPAEQDALAQALPILKSLAVRLATDAAPQKLDGLPVADYLRAVAPSPGLDWSSTYALWLDIQTDDVDADEEMLLRHALTQLRFAATGKLVPPEFEANSRPTCFLYSTLSRFAAQAGALRVALATQQTTPGEPGFEPTWLRLRELAFELRRFCESAPDRETLQAFCTSLTALNDWLPAEESVGALPLTLAQWETRARQVARPLVPDVRRCLQALVAETSNWAGDLSAAIDRYRAAIDEQKAILEQTRNGELAHHNLPVIGERLNVLACAVLKTLDIREAARLNGAASDKLDLDRLIAVRVALQEAQEHLDRTVGAPINNVGSTALSKSEVEKTGWIGKMGSWEEHSKLIAGVRGLLAPDVTPDAIQQYLKSHVLLHRFEQERRLIAHAVSAVDAPAEKPSALLASTGTDKLAAPAFWGSVVFSGVALRHTLLSADRNAAVQRLKDVQDLIAQAGTLPREARSLPALQERTAEGLPADEAGLRNVATELEGILSELRPLAQPPPVFPDEESRQQQQLSVWQARFQLAFAPQQSDARAALAAAVTDLEWNRRKHETASRQVGIGGLSASGQDELLNLKLPKHLYLELKRAREGGMPELFRERSNRYLNSIMEKAR
jgi:hypothetical protein